jgi:hypothetical protein
MPTAKFKGRAARKACDPPLVTDLITAGHSRPSV